MGKGRPILILVFIIVGVLFIFPLFGFNLLSTAPHGYDGIVAVNGGIDHPGYNDDAVSYLSDLYYQGVDPFDYPPAGPYPTGVKASIGRTQYIGSEDRDPIVTTENVVDEAGNAFTKTTTIKVSKIHFETYISILTYGSGQQSIYDVTFWFQIYNNDFSIFTGADEIAIAVLEVYTAGLPDIVQPGDALDVMPDRGNTPFSLHDIESGQELSTIPDWLQTTGYVVENIERLRNVKFPIHVIEANPGYGWMGARIEAQVDYTIGIDIMLFGQWTELLPYRTDIPPPPDLTIWDMLGLFFQDLLSSIAVVVWVIVGVLLSVAVLKWVPGQYKFVGVAALWVMIFLFGLGGLATLERLFVNSS